MFIDGTDETVTESLRKLKMSDKLAESKKAWGCGVAVLSALGAGGIVFADLRNPGIPLTVLGVLALASTIFWFVANTGDVDDDRYEALYRLHRFLSGDCDAFTNYHYELDLRSYTDKRCMDKARSNPSGLFSGCGTFDCFFDLPVVTARVKLRDGTALLASVTRTTRQRTRTRRNFRGKTKTKTKLKYVDKYQLELKLPSSVPAPPQSRHHSGGGALFAHIPPKYRARGHKVVTSFSTKTTDSSFSCDGLLKLATWTFHQALGRRGS